jgi:hypothetical protein
LPKTRLFDGIGYVILKDGWGGNDLNIIFKSGRSWGHAQNSQNGFSIFSEGRGVTGSPSGKVTGSPGYTKAEEDDTFAHNCLLVNGVGQCQEPGDHESAPLGTRGVIERVDVADPYYRYALGDASAVYTGQSGISKLDKWLRHVVFVEDPDYLVIYDDIGAPEPSRFDWLLNGATVSVVDDMVTVNGGDLTVAVIEPADFLYEIEHFHYESWYTHDYDYIKVRPAVEEADAKFLTVHQLGEGFPSERVSVGNVIGVKVVDGDNLDLILFSADGNPVDQYVELGGYYQAIDGGDYLFESTGVRVQFDSYQVLRLTESSDVTPPVISSVAASDITTSSAAITWATDEPATSQVEYGPTGALGLSTDFDSSLVTDHSVGLTDLTAATTYYYRVRSEDAVGNPATSSIYSFTTGSGSQPPGDSDVNSDGTVDVLDMIMVGQHWGEAGPDGWIPEDVNEDGTIDVLDIVIIGQNWSG